jgi:hypothetical protein
MRIPSRSYKTSTLPLSEGGILTILHKWECLLMLQKHQHISDGSLDKHKKRLMEKGFA